MSVQPDEQKIPRSIAVYAPEYFTIRLKFFESTAVTSNGSSTLATSLLRLNNIYRPLATAHDPNGYDVWASLYKYNRVIGCVVKMRWVYADSTLSPGLMRCGYEILGSTSDTATTFKIGMEKQHFHYVGDVSSAIGKKSNTAGSETTGNNGCVPYCQTAEYVYNPTKISDNLEDLSEENTFVAFGATAAVPHTLSMWTTDYTSSLARVVNFEVSVVYTVQLRELRYDNGMLVEDTT